MPPRSQLLYLSAVILAGVLLGYVHRAIFPFYAVVFASLFLSAFLLARHIKRFGWIAHNLAFVFLALALTELYFVFEQTDSHAANPNLVNSRDWDSSLSSLGYVARPGTVRSVKTYGFGAGVVYDVHYSTDKDRVRVAPDSLKGHGPAVMFFGDSFTFGQGVNDDETLPNAFSILSGMRVLNFGVSGYGPHHMLRLMELDIPKKVEPQFPRLMVYTALPDHIQRAAGRADWAKDGPLYEVENNRAQYVGSFIEHNSACDPMAIRRTVIERLLKLSRIWKAYVGWVRAHYCLARDLDTLTHDRTRFLEIVKTANTIAQQKYQSRLVVILWDVTVADSFATDANDAKWIEAKLLENSIPTLTVSRTVNERDFETWNIKRDGHPNPAAYREVAKALVSWLQQNPSLLAPSRTKESRPADQESSYRSALP
jgi:hypothetical protein